MHTTEHNEQRSITLAEYKPGSRSRQRPAMLIALAVLLSTVLFLLVVRDRQFWSSSIQSAWSDLTAPDVTYTTARDRQPTPPAPQRTHPKKHPEPTAPIALDTQTAAPHPGRIALSPLHVEVIAHGNQGQTIRAHNSSINLDLQSQSLVPRAEASTGADDESKVTEASEQFRISPETAELVSNPVGITYPLLARQMKVQGSVMLQARVGKDGSIQDLQVLKGPEILSSAAMEAVRQWRFRPHLESGQPVETDASITVYFTIATH